ncbi:F-box protein FBW2 [Platanthera guangdongensis]|uniref:F-box protein FBW2 n=1 Tax=Platanthera guangdongensis TaxID=2320717 RepID=A0ABR2MX07_9ASPA
MEEQGSKRWEDMELDCLVAIFSKLGLDDLTAAVPFVCKSWSQASADPNCRRVLDFRRLDLKPSNPFARRFASQYSIPRFTFSGFLKFAVASSRRSAFELRFSPLFPPSMEVLSLASKENRCPGMKVLGLPRISVDDESQFLNLIANWKDLELLEMDSKPAKLTEMMKLIDLHCKNLGGLKLRGWISRDEALGIADSLPKLRFLDLSGSHLSKEEILIIVDGCRELKKLKVNDCVGFEGEDEEVKKIRATAMDVFEHEGCVIGDDSLHQNHDESDGDLDLQFTYFDYCFETWMF